MRTDLDALVDEAAKLQIAGKLEEAVRACHRALERDPACVPAKFVLSTSYARMGRFSDAIELLGQVILAEPRSFEALMSQSSLYAKTGRAVEGAALAQRAVEVRGEDSRAHFQLGLCFLALRRLADAESCFLRAIALDPRFAPALHSLGTAFQLRGSYGQAAQAFKQAVQMSQQPLYKLDLGETLLAMGELKRAETCAAACLAQNPESARAHLLLCGVLAELGRHELAEAHLRRALEFDVEGREALKMAHLQRQFGLSAEARANHLRAIAMEPESVWAYKALVYSQKVTDKDRPLVERLEGFLDHRTLSPTEFVAVHYSLGKSLEDLGDYESSMRHYDDANRVSREIKLNHSPFNRSKYEQSIDALIKAYTPSAPQQPRTSDTVTPIFIIGMMRSGTTLAEHILSCHPEVAAAGELGFWTRNSPRALAEGPASYEPLANEYMELLKSLSLGARNVTDKMPGNYRFAGLIHQALPHARMIHMRRSPVDTCVSIWATTNEHPNEGGHDKGDLVFVYQQYLRLMEHWRAVLPASCLLELDYEELVMNREAMTRKIVEFCGLKWSDVCLKPEENTRLVRTPSSNQVRQPVYDTSIGRGLRFKPWLGQFADLL